jgi:AI-2 transport protein TqsA
VRYMAEESKTLKALYAVLITIGIGFMLKVGSSVTLPLAISFFFFLLVNPMINKLERVRVPRLIAITLAMLLLVVIFVIMILFISLSVNTIIEGLPKYSSRFYYIFGGIEAMLEERLGLEADLQLFELLAIDWQGLLINTLTRISNSAVSISSTAVLVFIFVLFLLLERQSLIPKLRTALPNRNGMKLAVMFERINRQTSRYLVLKSFISLITGILFFVAAIATRLDFPFVWGVLAFIFNFIPSIGSVIITLMTVLMALLQFFPEYLNILYVAVIMTLIQTVMGNILDPRLQGSQLNLSPFVILVALVFWGFIWGIVGMFLAVPLTSILQIFFANTKGLKPVAILISSGKIYRKQIAEEDKRRRAKYDLERSLRRSRRLETVQNRRKGSSAAAAQEENR